MSKLSSKNMGLFVLGLLAVTFALLPDIAMAQVGGGGTTSNVGNNLFNDVQSLIRGNIGVLVGLLISLFGLWMWLVQQSSFGLVIVIAGAAVTAFPGIYAGISQGINNAFTDIDSNASAARNPN